MAFIGIRVPHECGRLFSKIEVPGEKTSVSEMHITLLYFGDNWPISEISKSIEVAYNALSEFSPFLITTNQVSCFSPSPDGKYPIITKIQSADLQKLRKKLANQFDKNNIEYSKVHKEYKPHITLSYAEDKINKIDFHPIEFMVNEVVLWCGDHGDDRLFTVFPLEGVQNKNALLVHKTNVFEKLANNPKQDFCTSTIKNGRKIK